MWRVAGGLLVYCAALTVIAGDFSFEGDDWWVFSWPFWIDFPGSLWAFARDCLRPVEGVYWITVFQLFGFNRVVFHLLSLLLAAGGALLFGLCLSKAFPRRLDLAAAAALFAFFLPTVSCLTYVLATDNSRLSVLLFWASALAFQKWAERGASTLGLAAPMALYVAAFFTYEAPSFLIFAIPALVWPVRMRAFPDSPRTGFLLKLGIGILTAFALAVAARFLLLSGGAVGHSRLFPAWELVWGYAALLPLYLAAAFTTLAAEARPWLMALGVAILCWAALAEAHRHRTSGEPSGEFHERGLYIVALAVGLYALGALPYQLAGYGSPAPKLTETVMIKWGLFPQGETAWFNFNWSSRVYSAGSYGVALALAWLFTGWSGKRARVIAMAWAAVAVGFMASFHVGLSSDWRQAAAIRNNVLRSLVSLAPAVTADTGLLFLDLPATQGRAAVFRGWNGLRELTRMIYGRKDVGAWYLFPYQWKWPNRLFHQAEVSEKGFLSRAMDKKGLAAPDSLLIFRPNGHGLEPVNEIAEGDGAAPTGIKWKNAHSIRSNPARIIGWLDDPFRGRPATNAWDSGLFFTLRIWDVKPDAWAPNQWGRNVVQDQPLEGLVRKGASAPAPLMPTPR